MHKITLALAGLAVAGLALQDLSHSHGGTYRGPSNAPPGGGAADTVPSGGASGGAGSGSSGSGGGAATGSGRSGGSSGPSGPGAPGRPGSGPASQQADVTTWELWWGFNREPYLNLKAAVNAVPVNEGSDDHFLGRAAPGLARDTLRPNEKTIFGSIVPALHRALATESHNEIVTGALIALAKIGEPPAGYELPSSTATIGRFLADANQEISETAAVSLGILADPSSISPLLALLDDTPAGRALCAREHEVPWRTRAFAAYGLGLVGHAQAEPDRRRFIVAKLAAAAERATAMATPDVEVACWTAMGLVPMPFDRDAKPAGAEGAPVPSDGRESQVRWLEARLANGAENHILRAQGPTALARLVADTPLDSDLRGEVAAFLMKLADDERLEREVRQSAVLALGAIADADDDARDVQVRASLEEITDHSPDLVMRNFALVTLARVAARPGAGARPLSGTEAVRKRLLLGLSAGNTSARPWAALALGVLGRDLMARGITPDPAVDEALQASLEKARAPDEVSALSIALGLRGRIEAKTLMRKKLVETQDDTARGYIAVGLGLSGAVDAAADIQEVVREAKFRPELLRQAAISLGLLGDKRVVPSLIEMLANAGSLSARAALASALGFIGDARSVEPLISMLADREITAGARGFAAVALGIVADKEPLPWNVKLSVDVNYRANVETLTNGAGTGILDIL